MAASYFYSPDDVLAEHGSSTSLAGRDAKAVDEGFLVGLALSFIIAPIVFALLVLAVSCISRRINTTRGHAQPALPRSTVSYRAIVAENLDADAAVWARARAIALAVLLAREQQMRDAVMEEVEIGATELAQFDPVPAYEAPPDYDEIAEV